MLYETYNDIRKSSLALSLNESKDCAVVAVAAAAEVEYDVAHGILKSLGRQDRKGTAIGQITSAIRILGFRLDKVQTTCKTVSKLPSYLSRSRTYLVYTRGHVLCVNKGKVLDWTEGRQHRIREVYEVVPTDCGVEYDVAPAPTPTPAPAPTLGVVAKIHAYCTENSTKPLKQLRQELKALGYNQNTVNRQVSEWAKK